MRLIVRLRKLSEFNIVIIAMHEISYGRRGASKFVEGIHMFSAEKLGKVTSFVNG